MALVRMAFENYRCFKDRQEIDLHPITVILGKNNSGKSAITRLPLILETGVRTDSPLPLDLDALGDDPPDFLDLVYGRYVHRPLGLEFRVRDHEGVLNDIKATIQNISETRTQVVSSLEILHGIQHFLLDWEPERAQKVYQITGSTSEMSARGPVTFKGLLPKSPIRPGDELLTSVLMAQYHIRQGFDRIRYLSPYRQRPTRLTRLVSRITDDVGPAGENALGMLVNDHVRGGGELAGKVNELLGGGLAGWTIEVEPQGPLYAVNLRSITDSDLVVNLLDSGTGVAQVLPILVQQAQDMTAGEKGHSETLQVIEEPELHLHPAFHPLLADLFITMSAHGTRFLIETHSETLLLRLRRRIAEKKISPDDVAVYFVDHHDGASSARRIHIDELGSLDYWPEGVFSEDFEEAKKLTQLRLAWERDES